MNLSIILLLILYINHLKTACFQAKLTVSPPSFLSLCRLFDSQNNNRGGYNVGSLYYYTGSILSLEWTNQHSCGDPNNHCEQILQYMCDDNVRDGTSTS